LCSNPFVDKSTQIELLYPNNNFSILYLGSASLNFKDYIECTLKIFLKWLSKISDPFVSTLKVSNWWHFFIFLTGPHTFIAFTSWNNRKNSVTRDAIKASVPKFLNFLGSQVNLKSRPK